MNEKTNPIAGQGERNICCPYYSKCLDYAIKLFWKFWNCTECPNRLAQSIKEYEYTTANTDLYYELSPDISQRIWKHGADRNDI
jgi:hypothetical protein